MASKVLERFPTETKPVSKDRTKELVSAGLHRAVLNHGMETVAKAAECHRRTIENALSMTTLPELHTLGNILSLEPTVLWEYLSELGFKIVPKEMALSSDMRLASDMSGALTTFIRLIEDGIRDHNDTLKAGEAFRKLIPKMAAIVQEADRIRTGDGK
jgi:lambda repressor-like predicted transcriptional regulator